MSSGAPASVAFDGADVLAWPRPGSGLVTIGCHVTRHAPETESDSGLAALALRSAARGAGGLDARDLALAFERLGGSLVPAAAPDTVGYWVTVLPEQLGEAVRLLRLVLDAPSFEPGAVGRERELLLVEAEQVRDDMGRWPLLLALRGAFGPCGYGLPLVGIPEALFALEANRMAAWYREAFGRRRGVVLAGDAPSEVLLDAGVSLSAPGGRPAAPAPAPDGVPAGWMPLPGPAELVETRAKAQTAIAMTFPGPARGERRRHAAEVWAAIAAGLGGRLFEALRSAKALAYSVVAGSLQRRHAGRLTTYIATSPAREAEAREGLLEELGRFRREPPADGELRRATAYLAGQAQVSRQRTPALASELLDAWLRGASMQELADPAGPYLAVTADQVWEVAQGLEAGTVGVVRGAG
jgi:zinc protease